VTLKLTELQKRLCNVLQDGLPISPRPFADLANSLGADEDSVLHEVRQLKGDGIIRRIGPAVNARALGRASALVTAHVPDEDVRAVAGAVNALQGVSHNYLRKHNYNLWFTLQAGSPNEIDRTLANLSGRFGVDFHSLPVERTFKLNVRFDIEGKGRAETEDAPEVPGDKAVELTEKQKDILSKLPADLDIAAKPFDSLCESGFDEREVLTIMRSLIDAGVIRRIAAVLDYRKLGFTANVMFCCAAAPDKVVTAGENLARFAIVSHCYQRLTFEGWPYNLYAMMHARSMGEIQRVVDKFLQAQAIDSYELLPTEAELKKHPVRQEFRGS
jgi:DNA-binding Lrp family transcriptional regulator